MSLLQEMGCVAEVANVGSGMTFLSTNPAPPPSSWAQFLSSSETYFSHLSNGDNHHIPASNHSKLLLLWRAWHGLQLDGSCCHYIKDMFVAHALLPAHHICTHLGFSHNTYSSQSEPMPTRLMKPPTHEFSWKSRV